MIFYFQKIKRHQIIVQDMYFATTIAHFHCILDYAVRRRYELYFKSFHIPTRDLIIMWKTDIVNSTLPSYLG